MNQSFWTDQQGQDLTEYALMLAFVVLAAASLFLTSTSSVFRVTASGAAGALRGFVT